MRQTSLSSSANVSHLRIYKRKKNINKQTVKNVNHPQIVDIAVNVNRCTSRRRLNLIPHFAILQKSNAFPHQLIEHNKLPRGGKKQWCYIILN